MIPSRRVGKGERGGTSVSGSIVMNSTSMYRMNAEDCLRIARTANDQRDRPFWLSLAQSWLHLAEHSARGGDLELVDPHTRSGTH